MHFPKEFLEEIAGKLSQNITKRLPGGISGEANGVNLARFNERIADFLKEFYVENFPRAERESLEIFLKQTQNDYLRNFGESSKKIYGRYCKASPKCLSQMKF